MRSDSSYLASVCWIVMAASVLVGVAAAEEAECPTIGVTVDNTYVSKYVWHGYDLFDDHAAYQPSVDLDLFGSGFSINVWGSIPMGTGSNGHADGINRWQEYDYTIAYGTSLFDEAWYAVDFGINYIYYDFPKIDREADTMEVGGGVAFPNLIEVCGVAIVPSYYTGAFWPTTGKGDVDMDNAGWWHVLGLSCDLTAPGIIPGTNEQVFSFSWDITFNDGVFEADQDWSHTTIGVSAPVDVCPAVCVTPFLNFQMSMEEDVNPEDELYGGVSVSVSF